MLQRFSAAELAEDHVEFTDDELEQLDLLVEKLEHVRLDRSCCREVDNVAVSLLADAVDATDPLLDDHGIPW